MLTPDLENQIAALAARYGAPRRATASVERWPFTIGGVSDRVGEVCMVIRRPSGRLLIATKTFYPPHAHRLMTGGVRHNEALDAALMREVFEETGLDVTITRFLAVVEYQAASAHFDFATFAFLLDEVGGTLAPTDETEQLAEFREIAVDDLPAIAETLATRLPESTHAELSGNWGDWGRFRAIVHRVVHAALRE